MNVLVIGRGSIGKKHVKTLRHLARRYQLAVRVFNPAHRGVAYYAELRWTLKRLKIDAALVCNPTSLHVKTALVCLRAGAHVFLEKPLAARFDARAFGALKRLVKGKHRTLMLGYDMRFNPWVKKLKELVDREVIGDIWGARVMAGQYLSDWRPGTDYRKGYGAKRVLGGGVLLDLSHELDYLHWLLPKRIKRVDARKLHTGRLAIETEDIASIIFEYADHSTAQVHLDYLTVPYRRSLELYGEKGTILWDDNAHELRLYTRRTGAWKKLPVSARAATGDAVFAKELSHFFDCIRSKRTPLNSLEGGVYVMRMAEAASKSSELGRSVAF